MKVNNENEGNTLVEYFDIRDSFNPVQKLLLSYMITIIECPFSEEFSKTACKWERRLKIAKYLKSFSEKYGKKTPKS